jgi:AcrR family transcriptional regulator
MTAKTADRASARERLLAAADELFYKEGVHTVGIDRVIEHAGVAKATLYSVFGSKDELIRAYLESRHQSRQDRIARHLARSGTPRERLLAVFDALGEAFAEPGYHGCAFLNASAEASPGSPILTITDGYRTWVRNLFTELARATDIDEPEQLAQQLALIYDGASISARMDRDPISAAAVARATAAALIDARLSKAAATA